MRYIFSVALILFVLLSIVFAIKEKYLKDTAMPDNNVIPAGKVFIVKDQSGGQGIRTQFIGVFTELSEEQKKEFRDKGYSIYKVELNKTYENGYTGLD